MSRRKRKKPYRAVAGPNWPECTCSPGKDRAHSRDCALFKPDWNGKCINCDASPIVPLTDMCGPCTFGEAATAGGNW